MGKTSKLAGRDAQSPRPVILPRLLGLYRMRDDLISAPEYCGIGVTLFERECPIKPIRIGNRKLWDVAALDAWIDRLAGAVNEHAEPQHNSNLAAIERMRIASQKNKKPGRRPKARQAQTR